MLQIENMIKWQHFEQRNGLQFKIQFNSNSKH